MPAEYLRVKSPSAEVQGHSPDERKTVPGKRNVMILEVIPIGNYAVRLVFDDMHSTGIFSWDYLAELGRNHDEYWQDYLDELAAKNMSRANRRRGADRARSAPWAPRTGSRFDLKMIMRASGPRSPWRRPARGRKGR